MKILLLGKDGQIGWELQRTLLPLGELISFGRRDLDLLDFIAIGKNIGDIRPDIIVNAAAYTAVDKAEEEQEFAMAVNGTAVGIIAEAAKKVGAGFIHYSTDYVFDGEKKEPYTEDDSPNPINFYGRSKLMGELAIKESGVKHIIFRTSWVYGLHGKNFLLTVLRLFRDCEVIKMIDDQYGSPTWSRMIAETTATIISENKNLFKEKQGIYHLTAGGKTSWYNFAQSIISQTAIDCPLKCKLTPIKASEYKSLAKRPSNSVLSTEKIQKDFKINIPEWSKCLKLAVDKITTEVIS